MSQLALPLGWPAEEGERDLIVSAANARAVHHLERWPLWPVMTTLLTGPRKSGRSLIGRIFVARTGGRLIDDAERRPEEDIFHAWNGAQAERRPLLVIAGAPPPTWPIALPDLRSRIAASPHVALGEPDDRLAAGLIEKQLGRRGLAAGPEIAAYLLPRIERSYVGIERIVDAIDEAAFARRSRPTVPLAREALRIIETGRSRSSAD